MKDLSFRSIAIILSIIIGFLVMANSAKFLFEFEALTKIEFQYILYSLAGLIFGLIIFCIGLFLVPKSKPQPKDIRIKKKNLYTLPFKHQFNSHFLSFLYSFHSFQLNNSQISKSENLRAFEQISNPKEEEQETKEEEQEKNHQKSEKIQQ